MKKFMLALAALFVMTVQASAMSYEQAREQALFLTDKMAYELNLTDDQYEAAYEINLDYLMRVDSYNDLYGAYWSQRNLDLSYILLDWQYRMYVDAAYFYRPLYWDAGYWHFGIYARYPHRDYYFFGRPGFYVSYRGGHSWYMNGGRSWYHGRSFGGPRNGMERMGMRDGFNRGDFGRGTRFGTQGNRSFGNGSRFGTQPQGRPRSFGSSNGNNAPRNFGGSITPSDRTFGGGNRSFGSSNRTFDGNSRQSSTRATVTRPSSSSFGSRFSSSAPSRTFTPNNNGSTRSFGGGNSSAPSNSMGVPSTRSGGSFGSGGSAPSRNFGGGSQAPARSFGGGSSGNRPSGGHFGNGR